MTQLKATQPYTFPKWDHYIDICIGDIPMIHIKGKRRNPDGPFSPENMTKEQHGGFVELRVTVGFDEGDDGWEVVAIDVWALGDDWIEIDQDQPLYPILHTAIMGDKDALKHIENGIADHDTGSDQ